VGWNLRRLCIDGHSHGNNQPQHEPGVNPDFGQVEADPAQLNLTAFEDFFDEQRPFFVEGSSIFQTGDYNLFYSRRIGRRPRYCALPDEVTERDRPEATVILGAVKLTGKTEGKTAFGLMQVITASERADISRTVDGEVVNEAALRQANVPCEFHRYDGAGHGFQDSTNPERYRQQQSEDAWAKSLDFLARNLA
jgi:hypothetical protein